jgi:uncharacterized protein with PhoU and TrkA domain
MTAEDNIHQINYLNESLLVGEILKEWNKNKPENEGLNIIIKAYAKMTMYVARLNNDIMAKDMLISKYRYEKNQALYELKELQTKYEHLKNLEL